MTTRRIAQLLLLVSLVASAWYFFVYLTKWEWNRALVAGIVLVVAEVGLAATLIVAKLDDIKRRTIDATDRAERIRARLDAHPTRSRSFDWLRQPDRVGVFVPVLLGAGVIASGLAWIVERVARMTSRSGTTTALSKDLAQLAPPESGFLGGDDPLGLLQWPGGG